MKQITMMKLMPIRRLNTKAKQISLAMKETSFCVMDVNNGLQTSLSSTTTSMNSTRHQAHSNANFAQMNIKQSWDLFGTQNPTMKVNNFNAQNATTHQLTLI